MAAAKTPSKAHRWFLQLEAHPAARLRGAVVGLAAATTASVVLLVAVLEHVASPWLRAPLVLVTGGLMSAAALGLGAALYELRYRQRASAGNAATDRTA
ncbi:hypothetical protein [Thermaerobacter composti]|uniref:Uncharacterized protein n=1 Tax=Thermaerobacter composti TaxID=554949 RepID=A0ABZ0QQ54_9FIRM|nr:hypothetical protein [Thermaerobacter composti]WPD19632.1 hypothetical protein Q5761_02885 [Thermaerobacter composti]